jgi:hypothetical protein
MAIAAQHATNASDLYKIFDTTKNANKILKVVLLSFVSLIPITNAFHSLIGE